MVDDRAGMKAVTFFMTKISSRLARGRFQTVRLKIDAWHKRFSTQRCNRNYPRSVITHGVDTLTTTWMILMQALWLRLRFNTMTKRLANWFAVFIRLSQKWCARIDHAALLKRIFAK